MAPYESTLILFGDIHNDSLSISRSVYDLDELQRFKINSKWTISKATAREYPSFDFWKEIKDLIFLNSSDLLPDFSGTFLYETKFDWNKDVRTKTILDLGEVYEIAEVILNEESVGVRISPPYTFDISEALKKGENKLKIEVTNTLIYEQKDKFSRYNQIEPAGMLGPVYIRFLE